MHVVRRPAAALCAAALGVLAVVTLPAVPASADDVRDRQQWYLSALDIPEVHKITQGEGVTVAVVDTGVDATHPDLKGNVLPGLDLFDDKAKGRVDRSTHGTAMASIIAGHGHGAGNADGVLGIAPKAKILPVTIKAKNQGIISPQALATGITWAVDHGADVINVSLSSSSDAALERAVDHAYENNVILVASVGNRQDALIGWPAMHPGALAVTGTDRKGGLGPESIPAEQTDIAAPSVDIVNALPGGSYGASTSTSSATAVASGAVALVRAKYPTLNSYKMFERILETTRDAGEPGTDPDYGWGVLDLRNALTGQPDGRHNKKAEPEPSEPTYSWHEKSDGGSIWEILIPAIGIPVILLILFSPLIFFLVWRRRRKRRRAAEAAAAAAPTTSDGGAPAATLQPAAPTAAAEDDAVWRPPAQ